MGFFVAGSSIREMNGLYGRVQSAPSSFQFQLAYRHDFTGWIMGLATATAEVERATGKRTEWVFLDTDAAVRFRHDGGQLIPGSGHTWSHVHRTEKSESDPKVGSAVVADPPVDDEEELPWQLVGIGAEEMLAKLRSYFRFYKHAVQKAIAGNDLPPVPPVGFTGSSAQSPPAGHVVPPILGVEAGGDVCRAGEPTTVRETLDGAIAAAANVRESWTEASLHLQKAACCRLWLLFPEAEASLDSALKLYPRYTRAWHERGILQLDQGRYADAIVSLETLLRVNREWPSIDRWLVLAHALARREREVGQQKRSAEYCVAWRQTSACNPEGPREEHADRGCHEQIARGLSGYCECKGILGHAAGTTCLHAPFVCEDECRKKWDALDDALRPQAEEELRQARFQEEDAEPCAATAPPEWCSTNHYTVVGLRCDFPAADAEGESDDLKRAFKRRSLQWHPDKRGGSLKAFQAVAAAYEVLADAVKRQAFDEGDELTRERNNDNTDGPSHKRAIEKKYFPERFDFEPFGDSHSDRRERAAYEKKLLARRHQDALARGAATQTEEDAPREEL